MTDEREVGLWDYAAVVWRRRVAILLLVTTALAVAAVGVLFRPVGYEVTARYRATDEGLAAEVREALRLRLFPPESITGLELTVTQAGRGLLVAVTGEAAAIRGRAFLDGLPGQFRRPPPRHAESSPALPLRPVPALPPAPSPPALVGVWTDELAEVERRLAVGSEAERSYLTARGLRLRELLEQARRDDAAAIVARERHRQEVGREQEQYERQVAAAAEAERRRRREREARELTMVHPPVLTTTPVPWVRAYLAAVLGALVFGALGALVLEWYEQECARRGGARG